MSAVGGPLPRPERPGGRASGRAGSKGAVAPPATGLPAELRGTGRDDVRLLVSSAAGHRDHPFSALPETLAAGDLLVVNDSATLPASLPARGPAGPFRLNLSTRYGPQLWLAEPRRSALQPGPVALERGSEGVVGASAAVGVRFVAPHPDLPRLWFVAASAPLEPCLAADGEPIRYGHVQQAQPLAAYQSGFARVPGSAEMPSAGRPFTPASVAALTARGVALAAVTLHAGVSSLELPEDGDAQLYAEPFRVTASAARTINEARRRGGRIVAVGTTVVRALETAFVEGRVRPLRGFTRRFVRPDTVRGAVDGLITGFHEPASSHLALLKAVAGNELVAGGYAAAAARGYLGHEFGDVHLLLPPSPRRTGS